VCVRTRSGPGSPRGQSAWGGGCDRIRAPLCLNHKSFRRRSTIALTKEENRIAEDSFRHTIAILGEYIDALSIAQTDSPAKISRNCRSVQIASADCDVAWCSGRVEIRIERIHSIDSIVMQQKEAAQCRISHSILAARMKISSRRF